MANELVFRDPNSGPVIKQGISELAKSIQTNNLRLVKTNNNQTFRLSVNGELVGKPLRDTFDCIIVGYLPKVSREFYIDAYDPDAAPKMPDCWSNLGDRPDPSSREPQSKTCASCPNDVKGTGDNGKSKACRYKRRVAVLLADDDSGEVYQLAVPAMSLFGKGQGNIHPFESYLQYLIANKTSPDYVVTTVEYVPESATIQLLFSPLRAITPEEEALVIDAQCDPETQRYIQLSPNFISAEDAPAIEHTAPAPKPAAQRVAAATRATAPVVEDDVEDAVVEEVEVEKAVPVPPKTRRAARPKAAPVEPEPEAVEPEPEPEPAPAPARAKRSAFADDDEPAPTRRTPPARRAAAATPAKPAPAAKGELADIISSWAEEEAAE